MDNSPDWHPWDKTVWFSFLKRMYYYNHNNDNPVTINFSDRSALWDSICRNPGITNRDKIMANNIISTIKSDSLKKSLTIMNYRHAYLTHRSDFEPNCGALMAETFPGKVANVLINSPSSRYPAGFFSVPVQHGRWDVAFAQMPDSAFAFSLKDSPFGRDNFDHFFWLNSLRDKKYEEMFTGVIYYLPLDRHLISFGYPYMMDEEKGKIMLERAALSGEDTDRVKNFSIPLYTDMGKSPKTWEAKYWYFWVNRMENRFFIIMYGLGLLITVYLTVRYVKASGSRW